MTLTDLRALISRALGGQPAEVQCLNARAARALRDRIYAQRHHFAQGTELQVSISNHVLTLKRKPNGIIKVRQL